MAFLLEAERYSSTSSQIVDTASGFIAHCIAQDFLLIPSQEKLGVTETLSFVGELVEPSRRVSAFHKSTAVPEPAEGRIKSAVTQIARKSKS